MLAALSVSISRREIVNMVLSPWEDMMALMSVYCWATLGQIALACKRERGCSGLTTMIAHRSRTRSILSVLHPRRRQLVRKVLLTRRLRPFAPRTRHVCLRTANSGRAAGDGPIRALPVLAPLRRRGPPGRCGLLAAVAREVLPAIERRGPIRAWIVDDTVLPKKGQHSVGVARQY